MITEERLQEIKSYWSVERYTVELAYLEISNTILELITALEEARTELDEVKKVAWKTVDLEEGNMLVFVGVHAVAWKQEWGEPKVGFTRWNDEEEQE